jgi:hypothetical protein
MQVRALNGKTPQLTPGHEVHLVTRSARMEQLAAIWGSADLVEMASWLGYPTCCTALGLRATPHRPCSFFCQETQRLALDYGNLTDHASSPPGRETLAEVLRWPVEWSSLHGIVEVKLPILKLCYDGDATATTYKVRLTGGELPEHAAQGLEFPYRQPELRRVLAHTERDCTTGGSV